MIHTKQTKTSKQEDMPSRRRGRGDDKTIDNTRSGKFTNRQETSVRSFGRNRTLQSTSRDTSDSSLRATSHQLRRKRRSLGMMLISSLSVVLFAGLIVYQLSAEVTVALRGSLDGLNDANQSSYQSTLDDYFSERPLERFRGIMNAESVSEYLQQNGHSEVASVDSIDFLSIGKTALILEVREPVARWIIGGKTQYVDDTGSIFTKNYYTAPDIKIIDKSGVTIQDSQVITSRRFLGFIGMAIGAHENQGINVKEIIIPPDSTRQIQLRTANSTLIKLATDRPVGVQAEDAARAIAYVERNHQRPMYIDVRVSGKAYYK